MFKKEISKKIVWKISESKVISLLTKSEKLVYADIRMTTPSTQNSVIIPEESTTGDEVKGNLGKAADFLNLESLIKSYSTQIDNLKKELRKEKRLLKDAFENDAVYREHNEKVKEANQKRIETRQQILNQPALKEIKEKLEELSEQIKENEETLSDYLLQYQKMTGSNEIEGDDGETRIIVNIAKLVKGSFKPKS